MSAKLALVPAINENDEIQIYGESDSDAEIRAAPRKKRKIVKTDFVEGFEFHYSDTDEKPKIIVSKKEEIMTSLDSKIKARRKKMKKDTKSSNEKTVKSTEKDSDDESNDDEDDENIPNEDVLKVKEKANKKKKAKNKKEEIEEEEEKEAEITYSNEVKEVVEVNDFADLDLSRPIMLALNKIGWSKPTPIQSSTIPVALLGKDICGCAATGTGKTGAFMIPIIERLLHKRPDPTSITRVLVLTPTRELAVQIFDVSKQLAQFTKISFALSTGGLQRSSQEAALRLGPDVVIATLGRLIDHLENAPNFNLSSIEILVLDEADRMLDEYFAEQMKEVIQRCFKMRQTMLFSATMTEKVKDLALLSLKNPVRVFVDKNRDLVLNLQQEFVKIRPKYDNDREAIVAALVKRTFHSQCIIFVETKKEAHRLHMVLGLLGINVGEFHGNLAQTQRLEALENFKKREIDVLVATDLLGRGLDIDDVATVINVSMPPSVERYIHRVGRTARAGKSGRSVTLAGEKERKMLTEIVKLSKIPVKQRVISSEIINKYKDKIKGLEKDIEEIEQEELEEKELRIAEIKANKAANIIKNKKETADERKRSWFQTHKERKDEKANLISKTKNMKTHGSLK